MLLALRCQCRNALDVVGCFVIGTSCQRISRYGMRFFGIRLRMRLSYGSDAVSRMLNSGTRAGELEQGATKAQRNYGNDWQSLIKPLLIEGSGTGAEGDQCLVDVVCQNDSNVLLSDMLIPTEVDQQKMRMAVRMQQAIRLGMVEQRRKSLLTGLMINSVSRSRSNS